jgi:hypothetical protein
MNKIDNFLYYTKFKIVKITKDGSDKSKYRILHQKVYKYPRLNKIFNPKWKHCYEEWGSILEEKTLEDAQSLISHWKNKYKEEEIYSE